MGLYVFILTILLFFSLPLFFMTKYRLLSVLISLEIAMLLVLLLLYFPMYLYLTSLSYLITFLCFAAGGAAVGLTLLVNLSRLTGNDYVYNLLYEKVASDSNITFFA